MALRPVDRGFSRRFGALNLFSLVLVVQVGQMVFLTVQRQLNFSLITGWAFSFGTIAIACLVAATSKCLDLTKPNLVAVFGFSFIVFVFLPLPTAVRHGIGTHGGNPTTFCLATSSAFLITMGTSLIITYAFKGLATRDRSVSLGAPLEPLVVILFALCVLGVLWFTLLVRGNLPILKKISGGTSQEVMIARNAALTGRSGSPVAYVFEFSRNFALPMVSAAALIAYKRLRSFEAGVFAALFLSVAFVASVLTLEKSPLVRLLVVCLVAWAWEGRPLSRRASLIAILAVGLTFLVLVRIGIGNGGTNNELGRVLNAAWQRVADGPTKIAGDYFAWQRESRSAFGFGRSTSVVSRLLTNQIVDPAARVYTYADPSGAIKGSANGAYFAQLWVDFGWYGIVAGSVIVGAGISTVQFLITRIEDAPIRAALFGLFAVQTAFLVVTAASESIFSFGFGALDLVVMVLISQSLRSHQSAQKFL